MNHSDSEYFRELPDPNWADYHAKVKRPMALRKIEETLKAGGYVSSDEFQRDMNLIFNNAYAVGVNLPWNAGVCLEGCDFYVFLMPMNIH